MHHSRKDSDSDSDDFIVAVRREHNHHCRIESLYSAYSPQFTLLETVTTPSDAKRLLFGHHFSYQTRGKQGKVNVYRCNVHTKYDHCMKIEHCSDGIKVLKRGKHSQALNKLWLFCFFNAHLSSWRSIVLLFPSSGCRSRTKWLGLEFSI